VRIIAFAWTAPALLAGRKTCTRRAWDDRYASRFRAGDLLAAYDRSPRYGGEQVAVIRLTAAPSKESTRAAPASDYEAEGFAFLEERGLRVDGVPPKVLWRVWHLRPRMMWVVRFELVSVGGRPGG
jgi:hypothetical protein